MAINNNTPSPADKERKKDNIKKIGIIGAIIAVILVAIGVAVSTGNNPLAPPSEPNQTPTQPPTTTEPESPSVIFPPDNDTDTTNYTTPIINETTTTANEEEVKEEEEENITTDNQSNITIPVEPPITNITIPTENVTIPIENETGIVIGNITTNGTDILTTIDFGEPIFDSVITLEENNTSSISNVTNTTISTIIPIDDGNIQVEAPELLELDTGIGDGIIAIN